MADKREDILARLVAIAESIPGVVTVSRNGGQLDDEQRPGIIILDADETAEASDPLRAPRRITMRPQIYIVLGDVAESIGTAVNAYRAALLKAVLQDAQLQTICGTNGGVQYNGCATALANGRTMEAEIGLDFSFSYILRPDQL